MFGAFKIRSLTLLISDRYMSEEWTFGLCVLATNSHSGSSLLGQLLLKDANAVNLVVLSLSFLINIRQLLVPRSHRVCVGTCIRNDSRGTGSVEQTESGRMTMIVGNPTFIEHTVTVVSPFMNQLLS